MSLPILKKESLHQSAAVLEVPDGRYGIPEKMKMGRDNGKTGNAVAHPLQASEEAHGLEHVRQELAMAKRMFGNHFSQLLAMEMQACAQIGRYQCPIPSSRCMLKTLMGTDEMVNIEDSFTSPDNTETIVDMSAMSVLKNA